MKLGSGRPTARRRGLTLIELAVVLVILVAVAGTIIPMTTGMLSRTESATGAASQLEILGAVQNFEHSSRRFPRDWDALVDNTGTRISYIRGGADLVEDAGLAAGEVEALLAAGI